jgi:hypothetical protein
MSLQIASPFQQFFDRDGSPLDNGFVYVGTANLNPETDPLIVFFDDALTIPAAQPLRTSNGYIVRNGSPARVYTSQEDFSLTVRDKNSVLVFTVADATAASNLATQFAQFVSDLADGSGSSLVGYNQGGTGAIDRTVESRLRDIPSVNDFPDIQTAIAAAVAGGFVIGVSSDTTVLIPTDAATLQIALDRLTPLNSQCQIELRFESAHQPASGATVSNGDYSQFRVTSVDAEVTISALFGTSDSFLTGNHAQMPRLECLIDANNQLGTGYYANSGSVGFIAAGCGLKNVWGTGLLAYGASRVFAENTIFTGCAVNGATGAGITSWNSIIAADGADVSNSNYYGAQAAHGGILNFDAGNADGCFRYGIRGSDGGYISADNATANNCGVFGSALGVGYGFYAFNQSTISARDASAINCISYGVIATGASNVHVRDGTFTGCGLAGVYSSTGSTIDASACDVSNSDQHGFWADGASSIAASSGTATGCGTGTIDAAVFADNGATVDIAGGTLSGSTGYAVRCQSGSTVNAENSDMTNAANRAAFVSNGSTLTADSATATGAGVEGINCGAGSIANIRLANFQRGGSPATTDIVVDSGSIINANGATGGTNIVKNTLNVNGIIFG